VIPIELKLRNFMAYREVSLPFSGIHLAALTGHNGAGKSSLLDAITWAVWGKARARRDDELIKLGETEMEVEFTFELNDNVYRLVRKRDASGRGRSNLSFQVEDAGGWRTLSESSLRATEKKINELLRLDYDTFINSAFLLQGRADEFTTKRPAERKKILSDILGLEIYDRYADKAKASAVEKEQEARVLESDIERIEGELAKEAEYREKLAEAQARAKALADELAAAEQKMETLRERHRAINDKQRQLDTLRDRLTAAETDMAELTEAIEAAQNVIGRYQAVLDRRVEIEAGLARLAEARQAVQDWDERLHESVRLSDRKNELDRAWHNAKAKIESDLRAVTTRTEILAPKADAAESHRQRLAEVQADLAALTQLEAEQTGQRETLGQLDQEAARLAEQNKQLKLEMDEIKENLTQLEEAGSNCPVCRRPLDEHHRAEVLGQFQADGKAKGDLYRANKNRLADIAQQQQNTRKQLADAEKRLRKLGGAQRTVAQVEQALQDAQSAAEELKTAQAEQSALQASLDKQSFATDVLANLAEVEAELAELGYDKAAHQQARAQVQALAEFENQGRDLADAETRIAEENQRRERDQGRLARLQQQTEDDRTLWIL